MGNARQHNVRLVQPFLPAQIKEPRQPNKVIQPVFARYLNASELTVRKWDAGEQHLGRVALVLRRIVPKQGLRVFTSTMPAAPPRRSALSFVVSQSLMQATPLRQFLMRPPYQNRLIRSIETDSPGGEAICRLAFWAPNKRVSARLRMFCLRNRRQLEKRPASSDANFGAKTLHEGGELLSSSSLARITKTRRPLGRWLRRESGCPASSRAISGPRPETRGEPVWINRANDPAGARGVSRCLRGSADRAG